MKRILPLFISGLLAVNQFTYAQWVQDILPAGGRSNLAGASNNKAAIFYGGVGPITYYNSVSLYNKSTGTWANNGGTGISRIKIAATSLGSRLYFGGGENGSHTGYVYKDQVNVYNTTTASWETPLTLSLARSEMGAAAAGSKVLFAGGIHLNPLATVNVVTDTVDVFDTLTGAHTIEHLSLNRYALCAASSGNIILFAGGRPNDFFGAPTNKVDIYDVCTNSWVTTAGDTLSVARTNASAVAVGNKIIIAGGQTGTIANAGVSNVVDIYDVVTKTWSHTTLSLARTNMSAAASTNFAVFAGGSSYTSYYTGMPTNFYANVDVYDLAQNQWTTSNLTTARAFAAAVAIDNTFVVGGGTGSDINPFGTLETFVAPAPPAIPSGLEALSINDSTAYTVWSPTATATSYIIRYREVGSCTWITDSVSTNSGNITGLTFNGTYEVQVSANNANGNSGYSESVFVVITGIEQFDKDLQFSIFPNPALDVIVIKTLDIKEKAEIRIENCLGQVVYSKTLQANTTNLSVNVSNFPKGFYTLELYYGTKMSTGRFIKE